MGAERGGEEFYINARGIKIDNLISNVLFHARFHLSRDTQIIKDNRRIGTRRVWIYHLVPIN